MSISLALRQAAPTLARHAGALSQATTSEHRVTAGTSQPRRLSYCAPAKPLAQARARLLASIQTDSSKLRTDTKGCEPASDSKSISPCGPKGPLSQAPVMTRTYHGNRCHAIQFRGIHATNANTYMTLMQGMSPSGNWYPTSRHELEKAAQVQSGFVVSAASARARVMQSPARLDVLPAGISMTSDPSVALRFGEHEPTTLRRERGQAIIYAIDIRHKKDVVDQREIPQRGVAGSEVEATWFGHVPPQCILGYYRSATKDTPAGSVYEPMGLEWVANPGYEPVRDGKIFMDKS